MKAFLEAISQRERYENIKNKVQEKQALLNIELQNLKAGKGGMKLLLSLKSKEDEIKAIEKHLKEV